MKTVYPQPGYVEQDLHDLLATNQFVYTECFTITPIVGSPLRYTSAQRNVTVVPVGEGPGLVTYRARELIIQGLRASMGVGIQVDEQSVELSYVDGAIFQAAATFPEALRQGRLDGATIRRDRYFAERWDTPWIAGCSMFAGRVSSLDSVGRQSATINVKSDLVLLNVQAPRDLWQPQCKHTWGDPGCGLLQADFVTQTIVGADSTRSIIKWAGVTDDFVMGKVHIESTDNVTRIRTILRVVAGDYAELIYPLDFDPPTGADVAFYPNCRRQFDRCGDFHAAPEEHFLGFPHVPIAETAA